MWRVVAHALIYVAPLCCDRHHFFQSIAIWQCHLQHSVGFSNSNSFWCWINDWKLIRTNSSGYLVSFLRLYWNMDENTVEFLIWNGTLPLSQPARINFPIACQILDSAMNSNIWPIYWMLRAMHNKHNVSTLAHNFIINLIELRIVFSSTHAYARTHTYMYHMCIIEQKHCTQSTSKMPKCQTESYSKSYWQSQLVNLMPTTLSPCLQHIFEMKNESIVYGTVLSELIEM